MLHYRRRQMETVIQLFKVLNVEAGNCSRTGNPSYNLELQDDAGQIITARTKPNAMIGFAVCYNWRNTQKKLVTHKALDGALIIDALAE